ncbi:MAG TPA: hypothetical protein VGQ52_06675 [Gemmatimonadaceae bacterium]|jgi:hypothetical protein|nr:hypothetical protein [Gemmatimonadaceae bacterium]
MAIRVIALTVILFLCFALAATLVRLPGSSPASDPAGATALPVLTVCFLQAAVVSYLILRSRWTGWPLAAAVFVVFYGVMTLMPQSDSVVFLTRLPAGTLPKLFLMGALIAAPFSVLAVVILGKRKGDSATVHQDSRQRMPTSEWIWKLALIALVYVCLYFTFGYYIAWRNPAVPTYYGGVDEGTFWTHMGTVARRTPWLIPFQVLRALCWTALALLVTRMLKRDRLETALVIGLLFAVMTAPLLLPNPYMPEAVRMAHLIETASSNFIFGTFVAWLLTQQRQTPSLAMLAALP